MVTTDNTSTGALIESLTEALPQALTEALPQALTEALPAYGTTEDGKHVDFPSSPIEVAMRYIQVTIGAVGILSNGLVVMVMVKCHSMLKYITNIYILNQSLIDATGSFFLVLTYALPNMTQWEMGGVAGELLCRVWITKYFYMGHDDVIDRESDSDDARTLLRHYASAAS